VSERGIALIAVARSIVAGRKDVNQQGAAEGGKAKNAADCDWLTLCYFNKLS